MFPKNYASLTVWRCNNKAYLGKELPYGESFLYATRLAYLFSFNQHRMQEEAGRLAMTASLDWIPDEATWTDLFSVVWSRSRANCLSNHTPCEVDGAEREASMKKISFSIKELISAERQLLE